MRRLQVLGLTLLAIFSIGALAASAASATEAGFLPLAALETPITFTGEGGISKFTVEEKSMECATLKTLKGELGKKGDTHITLGPVTLDLDGCKLAGGAIECVSETAAGVKDKEGLILMLADFHLINVLNAKNELEPGVGILILEPAGTVGEQIVNCGGVKLKLLGVLKGLVLVASLTADITTGTLDFVAAGEKCDTSDVLCEELAKKPFSGTFKKEDKPATEIAEVTLTLSQMVLVDD